MLKKDQIAQEDKYIKLFYSQLSEQKEITKEEKQRFIDTGLEKIGIKEPIKCLEGIVYYDRENDEIGKQLGIIANFYNKSHVEIIEEFQKKVGITSETATHPICFSLYQATDDKNEQKIYAILHRPQNNRPIFFEMMEIFGEEYIELFKRYGIDKMIALDDNVPLGKNSDRIITINQATKILDCYNEKLISK